jgi:hypothetical protein
MERSAIRERAQHQAPAPDFASLHPSYFFFLGEHTNALPYHRARRRRDPLAPRNEAYNRLTTRWIACGKPVDDRSEKLVHLPCGSQGQSCENPGYVPVRNAGYKPCARSRQPVNNR